MDKINIDFCIYDPSDAAHLLATPYGNQREHELSERKESGAVSLRKIIDSYYGHSKDEEEGVEPEPEKKPEPKKKPGRPPKDKD